MDSKRVLITGGSGFLGINLIRFLLKKGYEVNNIDIADFDYKDCKDKINTFKGDIRQIEDLEKAIEGVDIVVHCAAALPLYTKEEIFSIDIDGTRNVLEVSYRNNINKVIHVSSTAVYGVPDHHPLFEDDEMIGVGPYGEAKIKAEEICHEYKKKGMIIPIIRPKSFIGPERLGVFVLLYDFAYTKHHFPILGPGKNKFQLLDVEDLAEFIYITMTENELKVNDIFNVGAKEFTTIKEDFQAVLDEAEHGKRIKSISAKPAILFLKLFEKLGLSPLYQWIYDTVYRDSFVSIEKAAEILKFTPKFSNKDALIRNYKWYVENLDAFKSASGISHRVPWKQGILKIGKLFF